MTFAHFGPEDAPVSCTGCRAGRMGLCEICPGPKAIEPDSRHTPQRASKTLTPSAATLSDALSGEK